VDRLRKEGIRKLEERQAQKEAMLKRAVNKLHEDKPIQSEYQTKGVAIKAFWGE